MYANAALYGYRICLCISRKSNIIGIGKGNRPMAVKMTPKTIAIKPWLQNHVLRTNFLVPVLWLEIVVYSFSTSLIYTSHYSCENVSGAHIPNYVAGCILFQYFWSYVWFIIFHSTVDKIGGILVLKIQWTTFWPTLSWSVKEGYWDK